MATGPLNPKLVARPPVPIKPPDNSDPRGVADRDAPRSPHATFLTGTTLWQFYFDPAALNAGGKVVFGATVDLEAEDTGNQVTYQIVGEDEADIKLGLVNIGSPIARALIGKEEGDTAEVQAPGGVKHYEIVNVRYV